MSVILMAQLYACHNLSIKRPLVTASSEAALGVKWALHFLYQFQPF
jgi:hypothetical protein